MLKCSRKAAATIAATLSNKIRKRVVTVTTLLRYLEII